jgi:hypothetical protein
VIFESRFVCGGENRWFLIVLIVLIVLVVIVPGLDYGGRDGRVIKGKFARWRESLSVIWRG